MARSINSVGSAKQGERIWLTAGWAASNIYNREFCQSSLCYCFSQHKIKFQPVMGEYLIVQSSIFIYEYNLTSENYLIYSNKRFNKLFFRTREDYVKLIHLPGFNNWEKLKTTYYVSEERPSHRNKIPTVVYLVL